jgi:long-chain acyl-CoA synthetase
MPVGRRTAGMRSEGKRAGIFWKSLYTIADLLLFRPLKDRLGLKNARICYTGQAFLSQDVFKFYHCLNLPLRNCYFTTEAGLVACSTGWGPGAAVTPCSRTEIRITDRSEVVVRQPVPSSGYYKKPQETVEALESGWFSTGDSGRLTEDGGLVVAGRVQDLIQLADGEKISPQYIESALRSSPYIRDGWVVADNDKTAVSAIVVIDYDIVGQWAARRKISYAGFTDLGQKPEVYELVKEHIGRVNRLLLRGRGVKKYANLHKAFDPVEGDLTQNGKLRRAFLTKHYSWLIDALSGDAAQISIPGEAAPGDGGTIKIVEV